MDYEALGIYTEAVEQFEKCKYKRQYAIEDTVYYLQKILDDDITGANLQEIFSKTRLFEFDRKVRFWRKRANSVCERCERTKIKINSAIDK